MRQAYLVENVWIAAGYVCNYDVRGGYLVANLVHHRLGGDRIITSFPMYSIATLPIIPNIEKDEVELRLEWHCKETLTCHATLRRLAMGQDILGFILQSARKIAQIVRVIEYDWQPG